jgi:YihY family inner membrane protein
MQWLTQHISGRLHALTDEAGQPSSRLARVMLYLYELSVFAVHKLREDRASQMAAALTYHTLFSLLPTLVLMLVVAKAFVSEADLQTFKQNTVGWVVQFVQPEESPQEQVKVDPSPQTSGRGGIGAARTEREKREQLEELLGGLDQQLQGWLDELQRVDFRSIGVVGVLVFIYGATGLLATIEHSFNRILRATENRSWALRLPMYYTAITLAPLIILAGQYGQRRLFDLLESGGALTAWIAVPLGVLSPLLTTWVVLLALYMLMPNKKLPLNAAASGAFIAAIGLGGAVELFSLYVRNTGSASLYGALAMLPLGLMLVWVIWQIVLFGLELSSTIWLLPERRRAEQQRREQGESIDKAEGLIDTRLMLPALSAVHESFRQGKPVSIESLSRTLGVRDSIVMLMLNAARQRGWVHATDPAESQWALSRPAESITVCEVLEAGRELTGLNSQGDTVVRKLVSAESDAAQGLTLAQAAAKSSS